MEVDAASPASASFVYGLYIDRPFQVQVILYTFRSLEKNIALAPATCCECSILKLNSVKFPLAVL